MERFLFLVLVIQFTEAFCCLIFFLLFHKVLLPALTLRSSDKANVVSFLLAASFEEEESSKVLCSREQES